MARKKRCLIIAAIIFFIFTGICNAEPDSTIKYLMNDSLTMLEWGMYRMEKAFDIFYPDGKYKALLTDHHISTTVRYDFDKNKIIVSCVVGSGTPFGNKKEAKAACKDIVDSHKLILYVEPLTGKAFEHLRLYTDYFAHDGFERENKPKKIEQDIYKLIEIQIFCRYEKGTLEGIAPLLGKDIYFKE